MNKLKYLIIHCTATPEGMNVLPETVRGWHEQRWGKGAIGYRSLILLDGTVHRFREANENDIVEPNEITWGVSGVNSISHHVCYVGGLSSTPTWANTRGGKKLRTFAPKNTLTELQSKSLLAICKYYIDRMNPAILIAGHNQFDVKACPSFDVRKWCRENAIEEKNIFQNKPIGL